MANTTVTTQIVVQFDDQFTNAAIQANEKLKKSWEAVQKVQSEPTENIFQEMAQQRAKVAKHRIEEYEELTRGFREEIDKFVTSQEDSFLKLENHEKFGVVVGIVSLIRLIPTIMEPAVTALTAFYLAWKAGEELNEWRVGDQPIKKYVEGVQESLNHLASSESIGLPPIPQETVQSLESAKTCLQQIQNFQDIFITVNLVDNATQQAKAMRDEIEEIFSQDITQRVTIAEETVRSEMPFFSSAFNSSKTGSNTLGSLFGDGLPEFQTPSLDLSGFGDSVGNFASGINRVPRDMIAMIHKNEAVLPSDQAEEFRRSNSSGMTIQNLNFSFNVPNGLKLDREEFRNLAFMMRDELKRLDRRVN